MHGLSILMMVSSSQIGLDQRYGNYMMMAGRGGIQYASLESYSGRGVYPSGIEVKKI